MGVKLPRQAGVPELQLDTVYNRHVQPADKGFHGMAESVHTCPGHKMRRLQPHEYRIVQSDGGGDSGNDQDQFVFPFLVVDYRESGALGPGPGCGVHRHMRDIDDFTGGDPGKPRLCADLYPGLRSSA